MNDIVLNQKAKDLSELLCDIPYIRPIIEEAFKSGYSIGRTDAINQMRELVAEL